MEASQQDIIVDIPEERVKFFGTKGKMLLPSAETIANLLNQIPKSKVTTTGLIREHLAQQFNVEGVCPVTTQKALNILATSANYRSPYWRVLNQSGGLIAKFERQAQQLQQEGLSLNTSGKRPTIINYQDNLHQFT